MFSYRFAPLTLFVGYSIFAVGCLFFGPIQFANVQVPVLLWFLLAFLALFAAGFRLGARGEFQVEPEVLARRLDSSFNGLKPYFDLLLLWTVSSTLLGWGRSFLSGAPGGLDALGESYVEGYRDYVRGAANVDATYLINILDQAAVSLTLLIGLSYFERIRGARRIALVFVLISYVLLNLLWTGKQKYLGDAIVFGAAALLIAAAAHRTQVRARTVVKWLLAGLLVVAGFAEILRQRYMAAGIDLSNVLDKVHPLTSWDSDSAVVSVLGPEYGFAVGFFLFYFANGLYGLYLSLTLPFEWSYFVGSSYSLGRIVEIVLGQPGAVLERTYPYRVGEVYGWGFDKWHSALAWLASDLSFWGLLALTPVIGALIARIWREAVSGANPFAAPLFTYLCLGLVFAYSNNQLVHSLAGVMVLAFLVAAWAAKTLAPLESLRR